MNQTLHGQTVLVIDDHPTNLKVVADLLRPAQIHLLTARDGSSGIERARITQPDLILLDVQMPGIDGFETCRRLKANPLTHTIPVIFMTARDSIDDKLNGFAAGGVDYIAKPFQGEELLARVRTHLTLYTLQRALHAEIRERRMAEQALRKANHELQRLAVLDQLTQIANRRRFDEYLGQQLSHPNRPALSLMLCDVDFFKPYNDGYGHPAGDHCLQQVARCLSESVRHVNDLVARYGGEEFGIILPDTNHEGIQRVAEKIQAALRDAAIPHGYSSVNQYVTLSIGAAVAPAGVSSSSEWLIAAADSALYRAKQHGRNQLAINHNHTYDEAPLLSYSQRGDSSPQ
ncbi:MAG: diguanylate cyclase [Roseiflexaceae bacterium]